MTPTAHKRDAILQRDYRERLGQGGLRTLVSHEVIGTPTGGHYGYYGPPKGPGPLDGEPVKVWTVQFNYSDGTSTTSGGFGARSVPALA